jgi:hypothetical protein
VTNSRIFGSIVNFQNAGRSYRVEKDDRRAIIAATTPSEPAAKIVSGVHSVWFWFAKRLRQLRLANLYKSIWPARVSALKLKSIKSSLIR